MKKQTKMNLLFVLILFLVIATNYALLGFMDFNLYGYNLGEPFHFILRYCGVGFVNLFYVIAFKRIISSWVTKDELEDEQTKKKLQKRNLAYLGIILIANVVFMVWYTFLNHQYTMYGKQIELIGLKWMVSYAPTAKNMQSLKEAEDTLEEAKVVSWKEILISLLVVLANLIPAGLLLIFNRFRCYSRESASRFKKVMHSVNGFVTSLVLLSFAMLCVYEYVNIPEFRYQGYGTLKDVNTGKEFFVVKGGLVDSRDMFQTKVVRIPEKIWGKKVDAISDFIILPKTTYILPASMDWETHHITFERKDDDGDIDIIDSTWFYPNFPLQSIIVMEGEPQTWYVKNNTLYNMEETNMDISTSVMTEHVNLWIPKTLDKDYMEKSAYWPSFIMASKIDSLVVEEGHSIYKAKENALAEYKETASGERFTMVYSPLNQNSVKVDETDGEYVSIGRMGYGGVAVEIGKNVSQLKGLYHTGAGAISHIILEEGNENYVLYDDCLYTKDLTTLVCITRQKEYIENSEMMPARASIKLPDEAINRFNLFSGYFDFSNLDIELAENSQYCYEDGILLNAEKTKVYYIGASAITKGEYRWDLRVKLPDTVEWVDPNALEQFSNSGNYTFFDNNPYYLLNFDEEQKVGETTRNLVEWIRTWNELNPDRAIAYQGPASIDDEEYYNIFVEFHGENGGTTKVQVNLDVYESEA